MSGELSPTKAQDVHPDLEILQSVADKLEAMARGQRTLLGQLGVSLPKAPREQLLSNINETEAALPAWRQAIERLNGQWSAQKREQEELRALYATSQAINSTLDLATVLNTVMDHIIQLTGAERGFLMLRDEESGELEFKVARNMDRETLSGSSFEISLTVVNNVARDGQPVVTTNAQADPRFAMQESVVVFNLRSILCVPLRVRDKVIGVLYADNRIRTGLFTERDRDLLAAFANQAAAAIANAQLYERVRAMKTLMDNVFASITSGVITTDFADKVTLFNHAAETILGVLPQDATGHPYRDVLPLDGRFAHIIESVKQSNRAILDELKPDLPQRGQVTLSLSASPLRDEQSATLGVAIVLEDQTEIRRLEAKRDILRRVVSPSVFESLPDDPDEWALGGERREITTLFADIRNFTGYAEKLPPEQLITVLNQYLAIGADAVLKEEGTLDKFVGDMVMALFNAPQDMPQHALHAVRAALGMKETITAINRDQGEENKLWFGIGINSGVAVVGRIGTDKQMDYTAIGDVVNYGKRLQENARGGQILLSQATYEQVKDWVTVQALDPIQVKHRQSVEPVYELLSLK